MKIQKFNEKIMKTKKFSDMYNWSGKEKVIYAGTKKLNLKLGYKVIELLNSYGLGINSVEPGEWIKSRSYLLPDEVDLREYRVDIGKRQEWDDFIEEYDYDNEVKYDDTSEEEQEKIKEEYNNLPYDIHRDNIEFSVFLPSDVVETEAAAMADASIYLKILSKCNLAGGNYEYHVFENEPESFVKFLDLKKIRITNSNLITVPKISYRIYSDNKAIAMFEELLGSGHEKDKFFNEWLNLM